MPVGRLDPGRHGLGQRVGVRRERDRPFAKKMRIVLQVHFADACTAQPPNLLDDVEAGSRAGCRTILIDNGNETEWRLSGPRQPDHRSPDLAEAAEHIICSLLEK